MVRCSWKRARVLGAERFGLGGLDGGGEFLLALAEPGGLGSEFAEPGAAFFFGHGALLEGGEVAIHGGERVGELGADRGQLGGPGLADASVKRDDLAREDCPLYLLLHLREILISSIRVVLISSPFG